MTSLRRILRDSISNVACVFWSHLWYCYTTFAPCVHEQGNTFISSPICLMEPSLDCQPRAPSAREVCASVGVTLLFFYGFHQHRSVVVFFEGCLCKQVSCFTSQMHHNTTQHHTSRRVLLIFFFFNLWERLFAMVSRLPVLSGRCLAVLLSVGGWLMWGWVGTRAEEQKQSNVWQMGFQFYPSQEQNRTACLFHI